MTPRRCRTDASKECEGVTSEGACRDGCPHKHRASSRGQTEGAMCPFLTSEAYAAVEACYSFLVRMRGRRGEG